MSFFMWMYQHVEVVDISLACVDYVLDLVITLEALGTHIRLIWITVHAGCGIIYYPSSFTT